MHMLNTRRLSLLALAAVSVTSGDALAQDGPSFDCARAKSATEKTICGDAGLAAQDRRVSAIYASRLKQIRTDAAARHTAMTRGKNFIKQRNLCGRDTACINNLYDVRFFDLASCIVITHGNELSGPVPKPTPASPDPASACTSAYKVDWSFLSVSEGGVWVEGYVPGYHREDRKNAGHIDKIRHYVSPDANSGVTIGKGVDLARQTPKKLRQDFQIYIKANGNSGNIDYEEIIRNLSPYMNKKLTGWAAVAKVKRDSPSLSKEEADFLTQAVEFRFVRQVEGQFNRKNEIGTTFQQLPAEAQTVLLDFSYNYGSSDAMAKKEKKTKQDSTRNITWSSYYSGEWQTLATKLQNFDIPDHRAMYKERRTREGKLLQRAVDEKRLPDKGNPCPSNDPKRTALFERRYLFFRYPERSMWS